VTVAFDTVSVLHGIERGRPRRRVRRARRPSAAAKTTLLNVCSGWLAPSAGTVDRPARLRMVFQQDGLFPWLTVSENILLGLNQVTDPAERKRRSEALLDLIGLQSFASVYPHQLSGGMRQRVELARALGGDTPLLLMDEPFSSLDYLTRLKMRRELARILREQPRTVVLVTHDIEEAAQLADRVLVLSERPARVRDEIVLDVPRPPRPDAPQVSPPSTGSSPFSGLNRRRRHAQSRSLTATLRGRNEHAVFAARQMGRRRASLRRAAGAPALPSVAAGRTTARARAAAPRVRRSQSAICR
jgi:NitT/TauT family transport system ATP-binding protein